MRNIPYAFVLIALASALLAACKHTKPLSISYEQSPLPAAPDYAQTSAWAALPSIKDSTDAVPASLGAVVAESLTADVFWIHPTQWYGRSAWNADMANQELNNTVDNGPMKFQATAFNGAGLVYAPRYRQMAYGGFFDRDTADFKKAIALAYSDVRAAFEYYLAHYNHGRPIIIAAHSQGSMHGKRLLQEFFDGKPLQKQLVAAYLIGYPFREADFRSIPVCDSPDQTGCAVGWHTFRNDHIPHNIDTYYKNAVQVNPVTWTRAGERSPADLHQGIVLRDFKVAKPGLVTAQNYKGILWCDNPIPGNTLRNYHIGDVNLFWMNIRENSMRRVAAYQAKAK